MPRQLLRRHDAQAFGDIGVLDGARFVGVRGAGLGVDGTESGKGSCGEGGGLEGAGREVVSMHLIFEVLGTKARPAPGRRWRQSSREAPHPRFSKVSRILTSTPYLT